MSNKIFTFSIPADEKAKLKTIVDLKAHCKKTGQNFSYICAEAIAMYLEAKNVKAE